MDLKLRRGLPGDAKTCGQICYEAFRAIAGDHKFPPNLLAADLAIELLLKQFSHPNYIDKHRWTPIEDLETKIMLKTWGVKTDDKREAAGTPPRKLQFPLSLTCGNRAEL